jgi:hypothetical protein
VPLFETFLRRLNPIFDDEGVGRINPDQIDIDDRRSLRAMIAGMGVEVTPELDRFIDDFPPALMDAFKAAIRSAVMDGKPVTFSWAPAYDYELHVWESRDFQGSKGAVNIQVRTRYPSDPHPLAGGSEAS